MPRSFSLTKTHMKRSGRPEMIRRVVSALIVLCLGGLLCVAPTEASISVVTSTWKQGFGSTTTTTTAAIDSSTGELAVVVVYSYVGSGGHSCAVSDSKSNSWTARTEYNNGGSYYLRTFYSVLTSVGASHTVTATCNTDAQPSLAVLVVKGTHATPYDSEVGENIDATTTAQHSTGLTPSQANTLVVAGLSIDDDSTPVTDGTWTEVSGTCVTGSGCVAMSYSIQTTAVLANPTWSWDGGSEYVVVNLTAFRAASGGGATSHNGLLLGVGK